jgi:hypothetical protein
LFYFQFSDFTVLKEGRFKAKRNILLKEGREKVEAGRPVKIPKLSVSGIVCLSAYGLNGRRTNSRGSVKAGSLKRNTALEYSTRVVQEGGRRCKKSTLNDLVHLTPLRIPLMNPP